MQIPPRYLPAVRVVLLFAIFLSAGPEILPAIEMATLLELLGTALFLSAFGAALNMVAIDVARRLQTFFFHPAPALSFVVMLMVLPLYVQFLWGA
jgi:hypothetical protein